MVELEQRVGNDDHASCASSAQQLDGSSLRSTTESDDCVIVRRRDNDVAAAMAIGAEEMTFRRLPSREFNAAEEAPERELLRGRIAVVELERSDVPGVAAILATATTSADQLGLDRRAAPTAVVDP